MAQDNYELPTKVSGIGAGKWMLCQSQSAKTHNLMLTSRLKHLELVDNWVQRMEIPYVGLMSLLKRPEDLSLNASAMWTCSNILAFCGPRNRISVNQEAGSLCTKTSVGQDAGPLCDLGSSLWTLNLLEAWCWVSQLSVLCKNKPVYSFLFFLPSLLLFSLFLSTSGNYESMHILYKSLIFLSLIQNVWRVRPMIQFLLKAEKIPLIIFKTYWKHDKCFED